jgi:hypothetical protein
LRRHWLATILQDSAIASNPVFLQVALRVRIKSNLCKFKISSLLFNDTIVWSALSEDPAIRPLRAHGFVESFFDAFMNSFGPTL